MNKIFKVIWCSSSQVWVAVSELSKVKPVSSVSSVKKTSSAVSTLLKTTALAIPFALSPLAAHAYVAIGGTASNNNGSWFSESGATATPKQGAALTWAYDYKNPGNKSYANANGASNRADSYADNGLTAYGVAIGNKSNALDDAGSSNGIAIGDYSDASGGLATSIGAFSHATNTGSTAIGTASRAAGFNSLAMMRQSAAIGDYSAAIGSVAYAKGSASFAFGASATANGDQSIAIGNTAPKTLDGLPGSGSEARRTRYDGENNTQTNGDRSVAIGSGAKTNGDDSFAFGSLAKTGEFYLGKDAYIEGNVTRPNTPAEKAIAFGTSSSASGNKSIAFGYNTLGGSENSIAFGVEAKAHKKDGIAFGSSANASEANSIAFGGNAQALHENVITIGKDSKATKKGAMTIGEGAQSNANNSLALGNGTIINQEDIKNKNAKYTNDGFEIENGVVAIANKGKERRLVNLAAGREDTDAVNVKQLSEVNDNLAKSIAGPNYNGYTVDGNGRYTYKAPDFEIKNQTLHNVKEAVELAQTNYVSVKSTIDPKTAGSNYDNKGAQGAGSIALGESTGTNAAAVDSVAIGHNTKVNGKNTVAIGANITAATNGSVILGDSSKADGSHATETVASKAIDGHTYNFAGKAKDAGRFVSVGEKGNERQIKNVAAGHVEADSTDAINGSQLYAVASRVEQGWKITAAKTGTGEVSGNAEKKVAMGDTVTFTAGDNIKITQNEKNLTVATKENVTFTNVTTGNTSLDDKGLTIKNGPSVTKDGVNAGNKKITNVLNGTISADSKDAVNGSQLYATNQNVTNNANNIANNAQNITKNAQNITKNAENIAKGLNFKGDNADVTVNRQLGETLNVTGGADKEQLTDNNIGVIGEKNSSAATGGLAIKLAKDLKGLNSVETKQIKLGDNNSNTTIKYEGDRIKYGDKTVANLDDEKHITNTTYAVGNDGNVSLTYTDGKGNVVNGMTATITGVAKNDLSNINNDGKKVITGLGTIVEAADSSVTVTNTTDAVGRTTYKVKANVPGADAFNIKYKANGANEQTVTLNKGLDFTDGNFTTASVAENGVVKYDVKTGNITNGVDGKTGVNGNDGLATVKTVVEAINNSGWLANATKSTGELDGTSTATKVKPGAVVNFDAGKNLTVKQQINGDNHTYTYSLSKDIEVENVVVTGKDGKDGKIGLNGKDGTNGKNGTNRVDIQVEKGVDGVDGKNGADGISRVVYEDGKGKHTVATMEDGLKFKGDDSTVIAKKLNEQLDIIGGATKTDLTDNNIGVNHDNGKLKVQLAKNLNLTDTGSIKFGDNNLNINKDGLTINNGPSITKDGIDGGNKQIKNVQEGTDDNDVVTVKQLKGSKTIIENGKNTTVTGVGTSADPYKVNVEGALKDITSITNKDGNGKVEFAGDQVVNVAGDNSIKLDAKTGDITGLTNKTIDGSDFATKGRAATEEQLKATGDQITNNLTKKGLNFGTQSTEVIHKNLGEKLEIVGEGTEADDRYDATNIKTMTKDGKVVVGLAKDLTADKVTVGQKGEPGKDGVDGQIGVNGKDGSAVVLNGKDGSIGLNGENGKNGVSIKGDQGPAGVDGAAGETKNRIVYEYKDPNDPNKTIKEDVATLNDGLKFAGDDGQTDSSKVIAKKLNQQVDIVGGADKDQLTENNIGVNNDNGKLKVQLAKDVNLTQDGSVTIGDTALNNGGLTITGGPSVTKGGINAGDKQITNVDSGLKKDGTKVALKDAEGDTLNNAVNVGDLKESISNITDSGFGLTDENGNDVKAKLGETVTVKGDGSVTTKVIEEDGKAKLQVGLNKDVTIGNDKEPGTITVKGENGKDGISINGKDGTIGLKGEDGKDGIALNGKDGTIGINGKDGSNGKITVAQGKAGLDGNDGKDGETKTRIVYEKPNGDKEEVATLNDGLRFKGDKGDSIAKKLNEELEILGKLDPNAAVTDKNLRVDNDAGKLVLKMAKQLQDLTSATFIDETTGNKSVIDGNGLTVTPKDADSTKTVSVTDKGLNNGGNQIVNVDSGLKKDGAKVELKDAQGDTLNNAVNVGDLKESITNLTNNGFGLTDENGKDVKAKLGETVTVKGDGSVTTKVIEEDGKAKLQVGLNKDVTIGNDKEPGTITVKGENGKDGISINGKDGSIGLKGEDGKDGIALNGKDGTIGINGKDGSNGKITVAQGQAGLDGNDGKDGKTKTRIVYEKPNGDKEEVATLNDGLRFTGNNEVENSHKLNSLVTIKGEGVDKAASEKFESAAGNVNVKADGKGTLEVQLAKDLKNIDSISNKDGQKIEFKDGGTTISGGNVSVAGNNITHVKAGEDDTDAVNVKQLKDGIAQATTKVAAGKNVNVTSDKNPDGSTTYTVATKDDVDFTSVTTGNTKMNDGGITIKAAEGGKTNVTLTNKGLDNGGNKVVNVADGDISATSKDAVNGSQLHNTKVELTNKGLDFGAQSGADIHKNLGEKLEIVGEGTKADDRYDATNIKTMTKDGKVVIGLDKDLKSDSVTVGSVGKDGKPGVDGKVGVNGKDGSSVVINGKDGSIGLTGPKGADGKSPSITVRTENGTTTVNEKDAGKPVERIKYTDSNNNTREVATLDDGLKFTGDDGKTVNRTLGSNLNIKGGAKDATSKDNIRITNDGKNGLKVQLANNVTLDNNGSVNVGGTRVDNNGITTNNGKGPSVTNNGVNAGNQKITNVKDGDINATSKDAVNGSQLHRAVQNIDNKFGDVYGKMNKINKEARAGIAGANAAAGLPQVYLPGKSMVAASAGTFKGQNALAIGYSRSSDNGKVILKLQGNANTQGDVGGSVGVGYQW